MKKKVGALLTVLLMLLNLLPAKAQGAEKDGIYERIQQSGELVVGLSADYAPYEFHADVDGKDKIVGFDVSIAEKIAKDMGVKLKIEELGFDALLGALKTGKSIWLFLVCLLLEERLKEVDFSDPTLSYNKKYWFVKMTRINLKRLLILMV